MSGKSEGTNGKGPRLIDEKPQLRDKFIARAIDGLTIEELSREFGVSTRTIYFWLANPRVAARIERAMDAILNAFVRRTANRYAAAHDRVQKIMEQTTESTEALEAAREILRPAMKLIAMRTKMAGRVASSGGEGVSKSREQLATEALALAFERRTLMSNGHSSNGHSSNGHSSNGHSSNGHSSNGRSSNGADHE